MGSVLIHNCQRFLLLALWSTEFILTGSSASLAFSHDTWYDDSFHDLIPARHAPRDLRNSSAIETLSQEQNDSCHSACHAARIFLVFTIFCPLQNCRCGVHDVLVFIHQRLNCFNISIGIILSRWDVWRPAISGGWNMNGEESGEFSVQKNKIYH